MYIQYGVPERNKLFFEPISLWVPEKVKGCYIQEHVLIPL